MKLTLKILIGLVLLMCASIPALAGEEKCALEYRFNAIWYAQPRRFDVELLFDGGNRVQTRLRLSPEWGGVTDFDRAIRYLRASDAAATLRSGTEPKTWTIMHAPSSRVSVRYSVVNDVENVDGDAPIHHRDFYRNMLGATYFQLFGYAVLVMPEHLRDTEAIPVCMTFSDLSPDWAFASSHGNGQREGTAAIKIRTTPLALRSAVYLGGDFRLHRRDIEGRPLFVAMRGSWRFDDAKFVDASASIVRAQRAFWDDYDFPSFLISLLPNRVAQGSTGGTALHNAFAMHASKDFSVPGPSFDHIIAHEHLHTWVPRRIGTMGTDEALRYWFSEGFTDYLTHRLLLKSGLWSLDDYARSLNAIVRQYQDSAARNVSNSQVLNAFWSDPAVERIPYLRGELLALRWSRALAAKDKSLEQILRKLRRGADEPRDELSKRPGDLAVNRLSSALRADLGSSVDQDLESFIDTGNTIPVESDFLGPCFAGARVARPRFELGFDRSSFETRKLTGLVPGSAAETAGLREGMALAGWSVYAGNPEKDAEIQVKEEGPLRSIKYIPRAAKDVEVFEFAVVPGALESAACRRWLDSA